MLHMKWQLISAWERVKRATIDFYGILICTLKRPVIHSKPRDSKTCRPCCLYRKCSNRLIHSNYKTVLVTDGNLSQLKFDSLGSRSYDWMSNKNRYRRGFAAPSCINARHCTADVWMGSVEPRFCEFSYCMESNSYCSIHFLQWTLLE